MSVGEALSLIQQTLDDGFTFFSRGTANNTAEPPTVADVVTTLHAVHDIVRNTAPDQLAVALDGCRVHQLCTALAVEPLLYAQEQDSGPSLQQTFVKIRLAALEAMGDVLSALAKARKGGPDPQRYASLDTLEALLSHVAAPMTFEQVRLTAAQCLFCHVAAAPQRLPANLVQAIVQCAVVEPAPVVRSAILCVLRELCASNAAALELEQQTLLKLVEVDECGDVRVLACEVLTCVATPQNVGDPHHTIQSLRHRLECFNQQTELAEAAALAGYLDRLMECSPEAVFTEICRQRLERPLLAAAAATMSPELLATLRRAVDTCPSELRLGTQLISNFHSFSALLKIVLDCHGHQDDAHGTNFLRCGIEASTCIAVLLAQNPAHRQQLTRELHAFPMWATTLKESLLHFLNACMLEDFSATNLVDVTNVRLNDPAAVDWNDHERPHRESIHHIFGAQERRVAEGTVHTAPGPQREINESAVRRRSKLTFVVLSYAVHATLTDELNPSAAANPAHAAATNPRTMERVQQGMRDAAAAEAMGATSAARTRTSEPAPKFPTPRAASRGASTAANRHRDPVTPAERQEVAFAYDRFDSAFKLTRQLSKYYAQAEHRQPKYEATPDGFVVRQQQLRNPWGPVVKKQQVKSWSVKDMKEGDLFYFAIPFDELSRASVECVLERARRHSAALKRAFVTTPQTARGRRWLVYDLMNNVIPGIEAALQRVHMLLGDYGDENVRFPVFLFREKEMHLGERALHCGNLLEVVDQVDYYFKQHPAELFGAPDDAHAIQKLEERLRELAATGADPGPAADNDDDDEGGHGGLSSDSEMDD
mmetsp:Transcript_34116/g.105445  ORF Transcript_34116/g.105445 Transcript_34116/m.105445 type:complete len:825 (-) Transcript_34116:60-2534(-)|eukprot:CAMPEP_0174843136 /NCGR_PEP_ID=MMETSP1114-20130205/10328_1 /TAXON_ID=312471 /ORGANISM="Neobodo designis, Strain CCAP 1951/1" /LENGTH=824 /DNA_ID=CAMNT_0016077349 /DNA_START=47 /DNA_END=2521 /DNA_ORIENTATION=+